MKPVVEIFQDIVSDVATKYGANVNYQHGHLLEINNTLVNMDKVPNLRDQIYPVIILSQDFEEESIDVHTELRNLRILIASSTKSDIKAKERYDLNFNPVLIPLYNLLITSIVKSGLFFWPGALNKPPHKRIDRPFLGVNTANGTIKYVMSDKLDAIEITNLRLNYFDEKC